MCFNGQIKPIIKNIKLSLFVININKNMVKFCRVLFFYYLNIVKNKYNDSL